MINIIDLLEHTQALGQVFCVCQGHSESLKPGGLYSKYDCNSFLSPTSLFITQHSTQPQRCITNLVHKCSS